MSVFAGKIRSEVFLKTVGVSPEDLTKFHEKSYQQGVRRDTPRIRFRVQGKMLERLLAKSETLVRIANKEGLLCPNAFYFPYLLMLTDANGVIMHTAGDEASVSNAERINNIGVGSSLSFSSAGTNAVSAAIELHRATYISGVQHYLDTFSDWTSISVPIRNSEHQIASFLAFSTYYKVPAPLIYPCIESISAKIEYELKKTEMQNKSWFVEEILEERLRSFPLTGREKEVAMYWLLDYDYKQIGKVVGISENTVRVYITRINSKLRVNSKASLILRVLGAI